MKRFKVEKNTSYTTINNEFLRSKKLSFKAKGVLAFIMSLPDNWDLSIAGIEAISKEGKDAVRNAVHELMDAGYIFREKAAKGWDYVVFEKPREPIKENLQTSENPTLDLSTLEKQTLENPTLDNPMQISKDLNNKRSNKVKKEKSKDKKGQKQVLTSSSSDVSLFNESKKAFLEFYLENKGCEYYFTGADAGSLKQLLQKIGFLQPKADASQNLSAFCLLLDKLQNGDKWVFDNLSLKILNSKFNEIVGKLKASKNVKYDSIEAEALKIING